MNIPTILGSVFQGICYGYGANTFKRDEDSARVGVHRSTTCFFQVTALYNVIEISEEALKAFSKNPSKTIPLSVKCILYLTPIITNILCSKLSLKENPYLKRGALSLNNHVGTACHLAVGVASAVLIFFGHPIRGVSSLSFILIGLMQRRCWLPLKTSNGINYIGFFGANLARVAFGGLYLKSVAFIEMSNFVYLQIPKSKKIAPERTDIALPTILTARSTSYTLNPSQLARESLIPPLPEDVDLNDLEKIFKTFDLKDPANLTVLKKAVKEDGHWQEFDADKNSDVELISYVETGLRTFIDGVSKCAIKTGDITDYTSIQTRAKHITHQLPSKSREDQFINLIYLALASYYCPSEYLEKSRAVFYTVCDAVETDSIENLFFQVIHQATRHLFQCFMSQTFPKGTFVAKFLVDPESNHNFNLFVNMMGEEFNLSETADAKQDAISSLDIVTQKLSSFIYKPLMTPFLRKFNIDFILVAVEEGIKNRQIPHGKLQEWFVNQHALALPSLDLQTDDPQKIREERLKWVRATVYDEMTGDIRRPYLAFFLYKIKVFEVSASPW